MQYYVYEHIRLDNAQPFYIGKGTIKNRRSTVRASKTKEWKAVVDIAGFRPRIIKHFETDDEARAFEAYIQPIYESLGIQLVNKAKCGIRSGCIGFKHSEEAKKLISEASKRSEAHPETKKAKQERSAGLRNPFADHKKYDFWHPVYGFVRCQQSVLRLKYNLSKSHITQVIKGTRFESGKWRLAINANKQSPREIQSTFRFSHPDHGLVECTKMQFQSRFPHVDQSCVSRLISGIYKSTKGWKIEQAI